MPVACAPGSLGSEDHTAVGAGGDGDGVADAGRELELVELVVAPGDDGAVVAQRQGMRVTGGDRGNAIEPGGRLQLAVAIIPPSVECSVSEDRQIVKSTGGYSDSGGMGQGGRHDTLSLRVVAPGND